LKQLIEKKRGFGNLGGDEAVEQYNNSMESGTPFLAVIMDLTIPGGLGGKEAAERILSVFPTACLIVSSGYSNDPIMSNYQEYGFSGAIAKPYDIHEVETVLYSLLTHCWEKDKSAIRPMSSSPHMWL